MAAPGIPNWQALILRGVGAPVTSENLKYIDDWTRAEGGSAENNPFNTTQPGYGTIGNYNSVGVKRYGSAQQGIQATIHTLLNGRYGNILGALRQGNSAIADARALAASPWGTGSLVLKMLGGSGSAPVTSAPTPVPHSGSVVAGGGNVLDAGGGASRQALAQLLLSGGGQINFGSNQVQAPNLIALSQLRQQAVTGSGTVKDVPAPLAAAHVTGGSQTGQSIAKSALSQLGTPYQWGGPAKLGSRTDCSGLLQASAAAHGVNIPRTTYDQWKVGTAVPKGNLQPGDAVFFRGSDARGSLPGHVGIYIGGGRFVEDPHTGGTVSISTLSGRSDYVGARRYV